MALVAKEEDGIEERSEDMSGERENVGLKRRCMAGREDEECSEVDEVEEGTEVGEEER